MQPIALCMEEPRKTTTLAVICSSCGLLVSRTAVATMLRQNSSNIATRMGLKCVSSRPPSSNGQRGILRRLGKPLCRPHRIQQDCPWLSGMLSSAKKLVWRHPLPPENSLMDSWGDVLYLYIYIFIYFYIFKFVRYYYIFYIFSIVIFLKTTQKVRMRSKKAEPIVLNDFESARFQKHELRVRAFPTRGYRALEKARGIPQAV
jgi:hypothetical protein